MRVELLNPEEAKELFLHWGNFAKVCYDTKTNYPEKIGKHCMKSGHYSGSRTRYFEFLVTDVPRFTIDQCIRADIGAVKNVQSFRYVGKGMFVYEVPSEIIDNKELLNKYNKHMVETANLYGEIQGYVLEKTGSKERANEQARYVLPISTHSSFVIGFTLEALIHFCNTRLCVRTEDVHRKMATMIRDEVLKVLPELSDKLVRNCQNLLWCPEMKGCGAYPTKDELKDKLNKIREEEKVSA